MLQQITYDRKRKSYTVADNPTEGYADKRAARLARIRAEGGSELANRVELLLTRYPQLKDRPLTAGEMVSEYRVWPGLNDTWVVYRPDGDPRTVQVRDGRFTCDCEDFAHHLTAQPSADGSSQQLCPHILAVCLEGWERWGGVLV